MTLHWLPFAVALIVAELFTGTFYLLVIGIAFAAGGFSAWAGGSNIVQDLVVFVTLTVGLTALTLRRRREQRTRNPQTDSLDIGQTVTVDYWLSDNTTRVTYRGSEWNARLIKPAQPLPAQCVIHAIEGNTLLLTAAHSAAHPPESP